MKTHLSPSRFFIALVFALCTQQSYAQVSEHVGEIGVRFMPTVSSFEARNADDGVVEGSFVVGPGFGAFIGVGITDHIGVQGEFIYTTLAQKYEDNSLERKIQISYVNIPLLLSINTGKTNPVNFNVVVGPQIGFNVGSKIETEEGPQVDTLNAVLAVKQSDLGFAYGAGLDFGLNPARTLRLGIGFRGVYGLLDISDRSNNLTTNSYYVLDRTNVKTYSGYIGLSVLF